MVAPSISHPTHHHHFPTAKARTLRIQELMERSARLSFLVGFLRQFLAVERNQGNRALIIRGIRSLEAERAEIVAATRLASEAKVAA